MTRLCAQKRRCISFLRRDIKAVLKTKDLDNLKLKDWPLKGDQNPDMTYSILPPSRLPQ